jgi:F-box and WD-40 domain protein 1/11
MSPDSSTHWNLDEQEQLQLPRPDHPGDGHAGVVYGVLLQGNYLVSVSADKTARIWDLKTQRLLHPPLVGHTGSVIAVQSDVADDAIITGDNDGNIMVWRFSTGEAVKTIPEAHHESVRCLHFDQRYLVTGGKDGKIKLWNRHSLDVNHTDVPEFAIRPAEGDRYQEYSLLTTLEGHDAAVLTLRLRDNILVSGSGDSTMCIWSLQTGQIIHKINIHQSGIASLRYNGRFIVSGSTDNSAKIYDVDKKVEVACLSGHTALIHSVQAVFGDDDGAEVKTIITGSYDGTVRVWEQVPGSREWRTQHQIDVGGFEADQEEVLQDNEARDIGRRNFRIFSVDLDANRLVCAGQGPVIRVWNLCSPSK